MRILPFVLYSYFNELSVEEEVELINNASSLTHRHEISRLGCKIYADYIKFLLDGADKFQALDQLKYNNYSEYYSEESLSYYTRIISGTIKDEFEDNISSSGFKQIFIRVKSSYKRTS